jgi:23S rRNA (uridine2552-2'-O)-methyltransferase
VTVLQADFRDPSLIETLKGAQADVVLSDLSPNLSGIPNVDQARAAEMVLAAVEFCQQNLKPDGVFVVKLFHGEAFKEVMARLKEVFKQVMVRKPAASRGESAETYVLARGLLCSAKTA